MIQNWGIVAKEYNTSLITSESAETNFHGVKVIDFETALFRDHDRFTQSDEEEQLIRDIKQLLTSTFIRSWNSSGQLNYKPDGIKLFQSEGFRDMVFGLIKRTHKDYFETTGIDVESVLNSLGNDLDKLIAAFPG